MIFSIIIGRGGSTGVPRKNLRKVCGHPLLAFPIMSSLGSKEVDLTFFSTEDEEMKKVAEDYGAVVLDRPAELATDEALAEDVFAHVYNKMRESFLEPVEFVLLLMANAVGLNHIMIDDMVAKLRVVSKADSICTLSEYPALSPYRMRKISYGVTSGDKPSDDYPTVVPFVDNNVSFDYYLLQEARCVGRVEKYYH